MTCVEEPTGIWHGPIKSNQQFWAFSEHIFTSGAICKVALNIIRWIDLDENALNVINNLLIELCQKNLHEINLVVKVKSPSNKAHKGFLKQFSAVFSPYYELNYEIGD